MDKIILALRRFWWGFQGRRRVRPGNIGSLARYAAAIYDIRAESPGAAAKRLCWYGYDNSWTFEQAVMVIDARKVWTATTVSPMAQSELPVGAAGALVFHAD